MTLQELMSAISIKDLKPPQKGVIKFVSHEFDEDLCDEIGFSLTNLFKDRTLGLVNDTGLRVQLTYSERIAKYYPSTTRTLTLALQILALRGVIPVESIGKVMVGCEIDCYLPKVLPISAIYSLVRTAVDFKCEKVLVHDENYGTAVFAAKNEVEVVAVENFEEVISHYADPLATLPLLRTQRYTPIKDHKPAVSLDEITHMGFAKKACVLAALTRYPIMFERDIESAGETMLARRIVSILPPMEPHEMHETTENYSLMGMLTQDRPYIHTRPFRAPHYTVSSAGMFGLESKIKNRPVCLGEVGLAHNGVLFLDELPEFHQDIIRDLKTQMKRTTVSIRSRKGSLDYPAKVLYAASALSSGAYPENFTTTESYKRRLDALRPLFPIWVKLPSKGVDKTPIISAEEAKRLVGKVFWTTPASGFEINPGEVSFPIKVILSVAAALSYMRNGESIEKRDIEEAFLFCPMYKKEWVENTPIPAVEKILGGKIETT